LDCHKCTVTSSLSRVHYHAFTGRLAGPKSLNLALRREAPRASSALAGVPTATRQLSCHEKLRLADLAAPRSPKHTLITSQIRSSSRRRRRRRRTGAAAARPRLPHFFLGFDEFA